MAYERRKLAFVINKEKLYNTYMALGSHGSWETNPYGKPKGALDRARTMKSDFFAKAASVRADMASFVEGLFAATAAPEKTKEDPKPAADHAEKLPATEEGEAPDKGKKDAQTDKGKKKTRTAA